MESGGPDDAALFPVLAAAADRLIPGDEWPSATGLGVISYVRARGVDYRSSALARRSQSPGLPLWTPRRWCVLVVASG